MVVIHPSHLQRQVREYAAFILGDKPWTIPTFERLTSFLKHKDNALGPSLENFSLDLESKGLASAWNKRAIEVFAIGFIACPEHDPVDKSSVKRVFGTHLATLRKHHNKFVSSVRLTDSNYIDIESRNQKIFDKRDMRKRGV